MYIVCESCAFTGHRQISDDLDEQKLIDIIKELIQKGVKTFYCGMAMGFDLLAAETLLKVKETYSDVKIIACIPYYGQEKNFSDADKKRYVDILKKADEQVLVSDRYYKGCMLKRDRYMADMADVLVAYKRKETGGTAYTVKYFEKKYPLKEIIYL
ncbi:MAG: DUF1273 family protein [Clostridia bacterium]|nr:DUF1273 family protein [Clostridia bacterium]